MKRLLLLLPLVGAVGTAQTAPTLDLKVDQVGYVTTAPKLAMVVSASAPRSFLVRDADTGRTVLSGALPPAVLDPDSGDRVHVADFSELTTPGTYYLDVPGVGRSWSFAIGPGVYNRAFYLAMRGFYGQRCGTAVDLAPAFPGYTYDICHRAGAYHSSSGRGGPAPSLRGWHDAGDFGRYVVNSGISTGTLLWAYELFGGRVGGIRLDIPESVDAVPDMLDEIRWNLDWMLSMQDEDGGVWHKQTSERFPGFVMPERDLLPSVIVGTDAPPFKGSCATADFAAVMAIAGRVYQSIDSTYASRALDAARRAWRWLDANPAIAFRNPPGVSTGEYGDANCGDERLWAAAELWRTAGGEEHHADFLRRYAEFRGRIRPPSWQGVAPLAIWSYLLAARGDDAASATLRQDTLAAADAVVERTARHAYRTSMMATDYVWGSNGVAANYGVQLLVANVLREDRRYVEAAMENLHYLLGRNTFSLSWVTHLGANPARRPHHRPSGADQNPEPWPGLLIGGPSRGREDAVLRALPEGPPARMYVDHQDSYASNEIAINWNAPLVFLLAALSGS